MYRKAELGDIGWTVLGSGVYALCQWAILAGLVRLGSLEDVGNFALGFAVAAPIFLLFGLNLRVVQATDTEGHFRFRDYLLLRGSATLAALFVVGLIAMVWTQLGGFVWVILGVAFAKAAETFFELIIGIYQRRSRFKSIALLQTSRGAIALIVFFLAFLISRSVAASVAAWAILWTLLAIPLVVREAKKETAIERGFGRHYASVNLSTVKQLLYLSLPLGLVAVLDSITLNIPRYILQASDGAAAVGVFSALAYVMVIGGVAVGALGYVVTPALAKAGVTKRRLFLRDLTAALIVALIIGGAGIVLSEYWGAKFLSTVYSEEVARFSSELTLTMWAALLWYLAGLIGCGLNALRRFQLHLFVHGVTAIAIATLSVLLIPDEGVRGGIMAMMLAMAVRASLAAACLGYCLRRSGVEP